MSEVILTQIQLWRQQAASPEGLSREEMRNAIAAIRKERVAASEVSSAKRTRTTAAKEKATPINSDDLLGELGL